MGPAAVRIDNRTLPTTRNWMEVRGLKPDTSYPYEIFVNDRRIGGGEVRTYPVRAIPHDVLCHRRFRHWRCVSKSRRAGDVERVREARRRTANPVRFILTMGDNIYAYVNIGIFDHGFRRPGSRLGRKILRALSRN